MPRSRPARPAPALLAALALLAACATPGRLPPGDEAGLQAALQAYALATATMDAHALGQAYAPRGALVDWKGVRHVGPEAVEAYLRGFTGFRVLESLMTVEEARAEGERVRQRGRAYQRVVLPGGEAVEAVVRFDATWVKEGGRWLLEELSTSPLPAQREP